jgi:hypothetical protein
MSILTRSENNEIYLFCKGADEIMFPKIKKGNFSFNYDL